MYVAPYDRCFAFVGETEGFLVLSQKTTINTGIAPFPLGHAPHLFLREELWAARRWSSTIVLIEEVTLSHDTQSIAPVRAVGWAEGTTHSWIGTIYEQDRRHEGRERSTTKK